MSKINIIPCGYRVLVKPPIVKEKTKGGIIMVEETINKDTAGAEEGKIIAIGETAWANCSKPWAEVGDMVYYAKYAGKVVFDRGVRYVLMADGDIMGILKGGKNA